MRIAILTALVFLSGAPVALAQDTASGAAPTGHETKEVDAPKIPAIGPTICVHTDPPTGSRFGARSTCHSEAEWKMIHDNSAQTMMQMQDRQENAEEFRILAAGGH